MDLEPPGEVLELATAGFRADETVVRVVGEDELQNGLPGVEHADGIGMHLHPFSAGRCACWSEIAPAGYFHDTHAAGCRMTVDTGTLEVDVTKGGNLNAAGSGGIEYRGPVLYGNGTVVYLDIYLVLFHDVSI